MSNKKLVINLAYFSNLRWLIKIMLIGLINGFDIRFIKKYKNSQFLQNIDHGIEQDKTVYSVVERDDQGRIVKVNIRGYQND